MNAVLGLVAVFVLTAATGYFVAQEFAYVSADRVTLDERASNGDKSAARAVRVMERLSFMLSGAQLGITVTALVVGFIAKPALADLIGPALERAGVPDGASGGIAVAAGFLLATIIQMVLGELFPKNLALARAEQLARVLASSTIMYMTIAAPLIRMFDAAATKLLRSVGIEPVEELHHGATLEELGHIIGESESNLSADHADLLERALVFSERTAEEAMVPRVDVITVPGTMPAGSMPEFVGAHGHTHYPVVGERVDDVIGIVGLRELIKLSPEEAGGTPVMAIARPALMVPTTVTLPGVVTQMQVGKEEIVCVVDEYGGFAGLVTWEDVAEELVGEISDESDDEEDLATRRGEWWSLDAGLRMDEVDQLTGIELPDGDYETLAGLVLQRLGRIAEPGDIVMVRPIPKRSGDRPVLAEIEVVSVHRHVPERLRIRAVPAAGEEKP